jgi:hypothetical protein
MTKEIDYVELLKLAHEKLGSQSDMIELLKSKLAGSKYTVDLFCVKYKELEKELSVTEKNLGTLQSTFEDIEAVFCDEDGCLIVEPFNSEGLSKWIKSHNLGQQAKGRLDGVAYALNMYCTTMSPKEFPPIGEYYAGQLQAKAPKE